MIGQFLLALFIWEVSKVLFVICAAYVKSLFDKRKIKDLMKETDNLLEKTKKLQTEPSR